jgi:hypothetical protein
LKSLIVPSLIQKLPPYKKPKVKTSKYHYVTYCKSRNCYIGHVTVSGKSHKRSFSANKYPNAEVLAAVFVNQSITKLGLNMVKNVIKDE